MCSICCKGTHEYARFLKPSELVGFAGSSGPAVGRTLAWTTTRSLATQSGRLRPRLTTSPCSANRNKWHDDWPGSLTTDLARILRILGGWLSGEVHRPSRWGHWFDPSTAHQYQTATTTLRWSFWVILSKRKNHVAHPLAAYPTPSTWSTCSAFPSTTEPQPPGGSYLGDDAHPIVTARAVPAICPVLNCEHCCRSASPLCA